SQVDLHAKYGGVVPGIASRKHVELILPVINQALEEAGVKPDQLDAVGVTYGPGLVGALLVGLSAAKGLAYSIGKPLVGVHHIEGHISANYLEHAGLEPPFVCLVASGGHSHIVNVASYNKFEILGQTRDDAAGEAFDKIARAVGLGYPGGPLIDRAAAKGNSRAIDLPRVYFPENSLDFSFSGLKTATLNYLNGMEQKGLEVSVEDLSASFQQAVVDVLVTNTIKAAKMKKSKIIALAGGVASNSQLRREMTERAGKDGITVVFPKPVLCTDNAAMIACAAYYEFSAGHVSDLHLNAIPGLKLGQR
ncbi:MAG: tRNA (adenosine(37)-N6)-threonylcarbamoyltransferase complex transferase subunit TsaD, partial [Clostridiales bacterium]|nr:tRNA (adenosine(37)-N6)-threonylcarbamoyltransferase complex transferase subunit TsaD [Clostridiales bacterium]